MISQDSLIVAGGNLADASSLSAGAELSPRRRGTLLVVDDEEGPRQSLRIIFTQDYEILIAHDGPTALELAQRHAVDVAVLDIRMAGMSGIEVLERLKHMNPCIEVVMVTAFEHPDTMRQALRLRACDYISKPFDISTIRAAVAGAMQRRSFMQELRANEDRLEGLRVELQNQKMEEQISRRRGEIYASIIHDINGPLTVISGFIQVLSQRIGNAPRLDVDDLDFIKDRLKVITRQVSNCIEISHRYLGFLRRESPGAPRVGLNQMIADLGLLLRVHPSLEDNQFTIHPLTEDLAVRIHGTDFIQVLLNLVVNGFQCSDQPHSVEIRCRRVEDPLDLDAFADGPHDRFLNREGFANLAPLVAITVCDTGPGIPPETLPRIFDPYFTTKGPRQGTGLGLSIVQRLIREAKGALQVHTVLSQGTAFTVFLQALPLEGA